MNTVTNVVNRLLVDDMQDVIDSPEKAYKALQGSKLFEAPSKRLKKTLSKLLDEKEEELKTVLADSFYLFQVAQGRPYTPSRANGRANDWLEKNTVPERETVFEICFSLQEKLKTVDAVKELITTGFGEHGFSVRSAKECVYFYCFASGKSYADAQRILGEYGKAEVCESSEGRYRVESGKGDTTLLLRRQLLNNEWDTEERFKEFLRDNKPLFVGYSKSFVREYEELYNRLSQKIRLYNIGKELEEAKRSRSFAKYFFQLVRREAPESIEENQQLAQLYIDYRELERKLSEAKTARETDLDVYYNDIEDYADSRQGDLLGIWNQVILPQIKETQKPIPANQMESFISQGIPRIKKKCRSANYNKGQKRRSVLKTKSDHREKSNSAITAYEARAKNKDSELYISTSYGVMAHFPQRDDILLPEGLYRSIESLSEANPFESLHYRKLLLLMFYYDYFFTVFCPSDVQNTLSPKFDFQVFVREATETLYRCSLAPLYKNEHFDWLILNSAAAIVDGCVPSHSIDSDDNNKYIGILKRVLTGVKYYFEIGYDAYDALCLTMENASTDEIMYLNGCFLGSSSDDVEELRGDLIAILTDKNMSTDNIDFLEAEIGSSAVYEDLLGDWGNNPLDFFGQVLRISYGF